MDLSARKMNLFWAGWGALFVLYAVEPGPIELTKFEYGLLLTAMATEGLMGSILCERIRRRIGTREALALDFLGTILLVEIPALTTNVWTVGLAASLGGFGASVWVILVASIRQQVAPDALLGRVYSASRFISWGVGPLDAALAAVTAQAWAIQIIFAMSGAASIYLLLLFLKLCPPQSFRILDEATEQA